MAGYKYSGQRFRQRPDGPEMILFVAPAEDIANWGGVPQKSSRFMKGFQRADNEAHWQDIADYFETPGNISPTAIVVAFKPGRTSLTTDENGSESLTVEYEDLDTLSNGELAARAIQELSLYESGGDEADDDSDTSDDEGEEEEEEEDLEAAELRVGGSHLSQFLAFLRDPEALEAAAKEDEAKLRSILLNLLKPATIVDGQHRTRGASFLEQEIAFPVVGLLDADWREQVFQFVVINQRAKPIPAQFLSAIISSSLSVSDIRTMSDRLEQAGVKLDNTRIMDLVNGDPRSPFRHMIDFKVQGSAGRLPYPGMLALARRFRGLRTHDREIRFPGFFKTVFRPAVSGSRYSDQRSHWNSTAWFEYFSVFWDTVRRHIADPEGGYEHLWSYKTNLLKIVALQELQNLFLHWLAVRRDPVDGVETYRGLAKHFLTNLKPIFFEKEWRLPSLQSGTGRVYLRTALTAAIQKPSFDYKEPLFTGVKGAKRAT